MMLLSHKAAPAATVVTGVLVTVLFSSLAWSQSSARIIGNTPRPLSNATFLGHEDPNKVIDFIVGLKFRNSEELDALIANQTDPGSADFRNFITPAEFTRRFGPLQTDVDRVTEHLQASGLFVTRVSSNHMLVQARGTVSQIEQAFNIRINKYRWNGEIHFSNDRDPSIPSAITGTVQSVMGLTSMLRIKHSLAQQPPAQATVSYTPLQIATAYSFPNGNNAFADAHLYTGSGVTLAIATAFDYDPTDVNFFWQYFGINRTGTIANVPISGSTGANVDPGETTVDIEQAGAQAPGADMLVYIIPNVDWTTFTTMYDQIVEDNAASVVSTSWGNCELVLPPAIVQSDHQIFQQGAAQGITFFFAGGDSGAFMCYPPNTNPTVAYPASDPYVTAVGGTTLLTDSSGVRASETAWQDSPGGASSIFSRPTWQRGPGVPQSQNRGISDVAFDADLNTGYWSYFQGNWLSNTGGTSFGAPNWAALWALGVEAEGGSRTGLANPFLYNLGNSVTYPKNFYDTRFGSNGCVIFDGCPGAGFSAGPHWDYPTGWGTPKGNNLVKAIQATFGH